MGSLSLLQKIFLTQESNWDLLHCRQVLDQLTYQGSLQLLRVKTNSQRPWEAWPFSSWEFFWTNPSVHFSLTDLTHLSVPWLGIDASHHKLFTYWSLKWVSSIFSWPSHSWSHLSFLREAFSSHPQTSMCVCLLASVRTGSLCMLPTLVSRRGSGRRQVFKECLLNESINDPHV